MRRKKEDAERTKTAILDAGVAVFAKRGYAEARLEEISRGAGVTRGAFYWHFSDKTDLLRQIVDRESRELDRVVRDALATRGSSFLRLRRLLTAVVDNFYDNRRFRQYVELTWYKLGAAPFQRLMVEKIAFVERFLAKMESLLRESVRTGDVKSETDPPLAAFHLSCLINGFYRLYFAAPKRGRDKAKTRRLFDEYLDSISAEQQKRR